MAREIFFKSVVEVMDEYSPVYPDSHEWSDAVELLLREDPEIISELQRQHSLKGSFREPIVLREADPDEPEPDNRNFVADGTHRVVAAHLLGVGRVLVTEEYDDPVESGHFAMTYIRRADSSTLTDDEADIFLEKLPSLSISDDLWITCDVSGGSPSGIQFYWNYYHDDEETLAAITTEIEARFRKKLPGLSLTVETVLEEL